MLKKLELLEILKRHAGDNVICTIETESFTARIVLDEMTVSDDPEEEDGTIMVWLRSADDSEDNEKSDLELELNNDSDYDLINDDDEETEYQIYLHGKEGIMYCIEMLITPIH